MFRRSTISMFGLAAVVASGCGGGAHFANQPRPPSPVSVSVFINDQQVSISPASTGAGPVVFLVTNQGTQAVSITILHAGTAAARTGPISPQASAQITVDLNQGIYQVASSTKAANQAAAATATPIRPAVLQIGKERASASNLLMNP